MKSSVPCIQSRARQRKMYNVIGSTGNEYTVLIGCDNGRMYAGCTCRAGQTLTLCKHIKGIIDKDEELTKLLYDQDFYGLLGEAENLNRKADKIKKEAAAKKKEFAHEFMVIVS